MTPKEKAEELLDKMTMEIGKFNSKQCSLIAVDEIIYNLSGLEDSVWHMNTKDYWQEVKQEIEKL